MAAQSNLRRTAAEDALAAFIDKWTSAARSRLRGTSRTTRIVTTLALTLTIVFGGEGARRRWKRQKQEREQGRKLVRTNSWLHNKDGSRTIYVPYKDSTSKVTINTTKALTFEAHRRLFFEPPTGIWLGRWHCSFSPDQAWVESGLFAPVFKSPEHHDSQMVKQRGRSAT